MILILLLLSCYLADTVTTRTVTLKLSSGDEITVRAYLDDAANDEVRGVGNSRIFTYFNVLLLLSL